MKHRILFLSVISYLFSCSAIAEEGDYSIDSGIKNLVADGESIQKVGTGYSFTEGGARDANGDVYFTDIPNQTVYKWVAETNKISLFLDNSQEANGTWVDDEGNLYLCQHAARQILSIDPEGNETVLVDRFGDKKLNSPNDLWVDAKGGIYFTDPRYGEERDDMEYGGEYVFYLSPDRSKTVVVDDSTTRPNGVIGTADGKTLYISDHGRKETYAYDIQADGSLGNKRLFANEGRDGLALDDQGNVYLTTNGVRIYSREGDYLGAIKVEKRPSNVSFGGKDRKTLFITAHDSVYTLKMNVSGVGSN